MQPYTLNTAKTGLLLAACLISLQTHAAAILTADGRYVDTYLGYTNVSDGGYRAFYPFENGYEGVGAYYEACPDNYCYPLVTAAGSAGASQDSGVITADPFSNPILATDLFGLGHAVSYINDPNNTLSGGNANADSVFSMSFTLLTAHTYNLTGYLSAVGAGNATLQLGGINLFTSNLAYSPFALNGILDAGNYTLFARATSFAYPNESGDSTFDFNLALTEVTAVPVPAAAWLLGSGLVGLVGISRKRRAV